MRSCVAFAFALALQTAAGAGETTDEWIQRLGDADPDVRVAAERGLRAVGKSIHPTLREALDHPDPEVRRRLARLLAAPREKRKPAPTYRYEYSFSERCEHVKAYRQAVLGASAPAHAARA